MLGTDQAVLEASSDVLEAYDRKKITAQQLIERLRAIDPASAPAALMEALLALDTGDLDAAERAFRDVIKATPLDVRAWMSLTAVRDQRLGSGSSLDPYRIVVMRELVLLDEVPEDLAEFEPVEGFDQSPEGLVAFATESEKALGGLPWPEELIPYELLSRVQLYALLGFNDDLLRDIAARFDVCAPVFRAALRQWSDNENSLSDEAAGLLIAVAGEHGGPEWIDLLIDDDQFATWELEYDAQWAVWRLGQRFPAEALEVLRSAVPRLDESGRAFAAEQLYLLPAETPGRKEAILSVLDGFPSGDASEPAAHLLLTVSTLMAMLGAAYDARAVLEKHQRRLDKKGRRWLQDSIESDDEFVPDLMEEAIDELTVEHICGELALRDDSEQNDFEDDYEEFAESDGFFDDGEFDDDFEDPEPVVAVSKPARNEECWCGSGKKYKKCHLAADEEEERAAAMGAADVRRLVDDISEVSASKLNRVDAKTANRLFFGGETNMLALDADEEIAFLQWTLFDFRPPSSGRTILEDYVRRKGRLSEADRALVEALRNARYSIWEVQRIEKGRGVEVKDYFGGDTIFVNDVSLDVAQSDCFVTYLFRRGDRWMFLDEGFAIDRDVLRQIVEMVEAGAREQGMAPGVYFRSRSHEWRRIAEDAPN